MYFRVFEGRVKVPEGVHPHDAPPTMAAALIPLAAPVGRRGRHQPARDADARTLPRAGRRREPRAGRASLRGSWRGSRCSSQSIGIAGRSGPVPDARRDRSPAQALRALRRRSSMPLGTSSMSTRSTGARSSCRGRRFAAFASDVSMPRVIDGAHHWHRPRASRPSPRASADCRPATSAATRSMFLFGVVVDPVGSSW